MAPGYTVTPYKIPVLRESNPKYSEHASAQKQLGERINETMTVSNEAYLKRMDERPSNQRKLKSLRQLNLTESHESCPVVTLPLISCQTYR